MADRRSASPEVRASEPRSASSTPSIRSSLSRDPAPRATLTRVGPIRSAFAISLQTATFALPPSGAAVTRTSSTPSRSPAISFLPARGRHPHPQLGAHRAPPGGPLPVRAERQQRALGAGGRPRGAEPAPVADQVDVRLVDVLAARWPRAARRAPPRTRRAGGSARAARRRGRRGCPPAAPGGRRRRAARRRRSCGPRPAAASRNSSASSRGASARKPRSRLPRSASIAPSIALIRRAFTFEMPPGPDRLLDLRLGRARDGLPVREPVPQPLVGDVAVAVVRVLGQHRQHQLVERRVVRLVVRHAVVGAQRVADRARQARARVAAGLIRIAMLVRQRVERAPALGRARGRGDRRAERIGGRLRREARVRQRRGQHAGDHVARAGGVDRVGRARPAHRRVAAPRSSAPSAPSVTATSRAPISTRRSAAPRRVGVAGEQLRLGAVHLQQRRALERGGRQLERLARIAPAAHPQVGVEQHVLAGGQRQLAGPQRQRALALADQRVGAEQQRVVRGDRLLEAVLEREDAGLDRPRRRR